MGQIKSFIGKMLFKGKGALLRHGPTIAVAAGVIGVVYAIGSAMTTAIDDEETQEIRAHVSRLEDLKSTQKEIEVTPESHPDTTLDAVIVERRKEGRAMAGSFLKTFRRPIIAGAVGVGLIGTGYLWLSKRFGATAAALASTAATLATVETNIARTWGEDAVICLRDPNWDPEILKKSREPSEGEAAPIEGYYDPFREYAAKQAHSNPMLDNDANIVHFNADTVEPGYRYPKLSSNLHLIRAAVDKAQSDLDYRDNCWFISRREMMDRLHLTSQAAHTDKRRIMQDAVDGWTKGQKIDVNINGLYQEYSKNLDNSAWIDELDRRHEDIVLKFNASPMALYDAFQIRYAQPSNQVVKA